MMVLALFLCVLLLLQCTTATVQRIQSFLCTKDKVNEMSKSAELLNMACVHKDQTLLLDVLASSASSQVIEKSLSDLQMETFFENVSNSELIKNIEYYYKLSPSKVGKALEFLSRNYDSAGTLNVDQYFRIFSAISVNRKDRHIHLLSEAAYEKMKRFHGLADELFAKFAEATRARGLLLKAAFRCFLKPLVQGAKFEVSYVRLCLEHLCANLWVPHWMYPEERGCSWMGEGQSEKLVTEYLAPLFKKSFNSDPSVCYQIVETLKNSARPELLKFLTDCLEGESLEAYHILSKDTSSNADKEIIPAPGCMPTEIRNHIIRNACQDFSFDRKKVIECGISGNHLVDVLTEDSRLENMIRLFNALYNNAEDFDAEFGNLKWKPYAKMVSEWLKSAQFNVKDVTLKTSCEHLVRRVEDIDPENLAKIIVHSGDFAYLPKNYSNESVFKFFHHSYLNNSLSLLKWPKSSDNMPETRTILKFWLADGEEATLTVKNDIMTELDLMHISKVTISAYILAEGLTLPREVRDHLFLEDFEDYCYRCGFHPDEWADERFFEQYLKRIAPQYAIEPFLPHVVPRLLSDLARHQEHLGCGSFYIFDCHFKYKAMALRKYIEETFGDKPVSDKELEALLVFLGISLCNSDDFLFYFFNQY